jgi:hypothetical protein
MHHCNRLDFAGPAELLAQDVHLAMPVNRAAHRFADEFTPYWRYMPSHIAS